MLWVYIAPGMHAFAYQACTASQSACYRALEIRAAPYVWLGHPIFGLRARAITCVLLPCFSVDFGPEDPSNFPCD